MCAAGPARAAHDVTISSGPTSGFSLATFTATADDAVLDVADLAGALQTRDVDVQTGSGGAQAGSITVAANVVATAGGELTLTPAATGTIQLAATTVDTQGSQRYGGPVGLASDVTLTSHGPTGIEFASTVDGAHALVASTDLGAPHVTFRGPVGAAVPLSSVRTSASDTLLFASVTTTGDQIYVDRALLPGGAVTLTSAAGTIAPFRVGLGASTLTFAGAGSVPGDVSGSGGIAKTGPGVLSLGNNPNTHTGPTTVAAGTLQIVGDNGPGTVLVTGGTLAGSGKTGPVTATAGVVQPTGLRAGSVMLGAGSVFGVALPYSGLPPALDVTGDVTIAGAALAVSADPRLVPLGIGPLTLIANDGADPVAGAFSGTRPDGTLALSAVARQPLRAPSLACPSGRAAR